MEIIGKIIAVLPVRSGVSQRTGSEWQVGSYVIETQGERFARRMLFEVFGADKIQQFNIQAGEMLHVSFDIDAREANGRWFNSIRAWAVDRNIDVNPAAAPGVAPSFAPFDPAAPQAPAPSEAPFVQAPDNEALPF